MRASSCLEYSFNTFEHPCARLGIVYSDPTDSRGIPVFGNTFLLYFDCPASINICNMNE